VIQLGFALLMMFSAWAAWRRNPMYSTRSTLRAAIVIVLAVAGVVAIMAAAIKLGMHRSTTVAGTVIASAIVFGTLALIFIIQAATVPKESKPASLPHSVHLVTNNRRKIVHWFKVLGVFVAVFALGGLLSGAAGIISLSLGGFTLFLAVILLPVAYVNLRGLDQSLTATELDPWVHWHYTLEQWQPWCAVQADRLRATPPTFVLQRDWRRFLFPFALIIGGVAIFAPGSWLFKGSYLTLVCGCILAVAILSGRGGAHTADKLHTHLLQAEPDAYFGRDGVFADGTFTPWLNVSIYLVSAAIDDRAPRSLLFSFDKIVPNPYGPTQPLAIHQAVLIPANFEADLTRLQQELTSRCPKAQISLA
jgi:hypothetical protein